MTFSDDLESVRLLHDRDLSDWLDAHAVASAAPQWWWGILESVESSVSIFRHISADERSNLLGIGARLLSAGRSRGRLSPSSVAYWQLRIAVVAMRSDPKIPGLVETLTPEGAARWAVNNMPSTRDETIEYARERASHYRRAGNDFYAPIGAAFQGKFQVDPHITILQDVEQILSVLEHVDSSRLENELRAEVEAWLGIRAELNI